MAFPTENAMMPLEGTLSILLNFTPSADVDMMTAPPVTPPQAHGVYTFGIL